MKENGEKGDTEGNLEKKRDPGGNMEEKKRDIEGNLEDKWRYRREHEINKAIPKETRRGK